MPRRLRIHQPGGFYHVTLRGNHQQDIFVASGDRRLLNVIVARATGKFAARVHAYCWMRNHLHLLLQAGAEPIARPMGQIASEFARAMQSKLDTTGHFFERRYHALLVDADSYLLELLRYIHLNPVRARVVADVEQYPWSSHHVYTGAREEPWVTTDFVLRLFGQKRGVAVEAYRQFVLSPHDDSFEQKLGSSDSFLGDDCFTARLQPEQSRATSSQQDLKALILEACERFEVEPARLTTPVRDKYLVKVRAWIAFQAEKRGTATRSAVARALGRTESTLRSAIQMYPEELE